MHSLEALVLPIFSVRTHRAHGLDESTWIRNETAHRGPAICADAVVKLVHDARPWGGC
jgi:hypothetical protein